MAERREATVATENQPHLAAHGLDGVGRMPNSSNMMHNVAAPSHWTCLRKHLGANELLHNKRVSDASFSEVEKRFGKPAVVDLVGIIGYYTFDAMMLNTAQFKAPEGPLLPHFPD